MKNLTHWHRHKHTMHQKYVNRLGLLTVWSLQWCHCVLWVSVWTQYVCLGVFSWPWLGLLWRGQHFCRSLTHSCVIVLGRKWCHAIVLFPSRDGKWTSEGYRMGCLSVCLSGYKCLLSLWMSGSAERATNTMKCSLSWAAETQDAVRSPDTRFAWSCHIVLN